MFVTRASQLTEDSVEVEVADLDGLLGDFYIGISIFAMMKIMMKREPTDESDVALGIPNLFAALGERVDRDGRKAWDCSCGGGCQEGREDEAGVMHLE